MRAISSPRTSALIATIYAITTVNVLTLASANMIQCEYFNTSTCTGEDTNYALKNYGICLFSACGGDDVVVTTLDTTAAVGSSNIGAMGASCVGDTYLRLMDPDGDLLGYNDDTSDDSESDSDKCSEIVFSLPMHHPCYDYEVRVGCYGDKDCEAQVVVNVTDTRPSFESDSMNISSDDSWMMNCTEFNLTKSTNSIENIFDFEPENTAVCSFEVCPGHYYTVELNNCNNGSTTDIFSYGGAANVDGMIGSVACGASPVVVDGFGGSESTAGGQCHMVSMYQTCSNETADGAYCSGRSVVTAKKLPGIDVQWLDDLLATPGLPLRFMISNFTANDPTAESYLEADSSDLYIAVYKLDMFEDQEHCDYIVLDSTSAVKFYDYIDLEPWDGIEKTEYISTIPMGNNGTRYLVSEFGGSYKIIVWLWRKTLNGMDSPYMLASSNRLRVGGTSSISIEVSEAIAGGYVSGTFTFSNARTEIGDQLVIYALDATGVCNSKHDVLDFDSAIWNQKITTDDMETDTFTTATVHDLSEAFVLPLENDCNRVQQFELRYIRDGEVIGRSTVLPVGSPTSAPTAVVSSKHGNDDHTLEYGLLITAIVVVTISAIIYVVYFQKINPSEAEMTRSCDKRGGTGNKKGGFAALSTQNSDTSPEGFQDIDVDMVDPSLFQIEMVSDGGDDDDEEIVF